MHLAKNFSWDEVRCRCGCKTPLSVMVQAVALSHRLQAIRDQYGPVEVTSWYRCPARNKAVGGAPASVHLTGQAADIKCPGCPNLASVCDVAFQDGGVGTYIQYPQMVHVDARGKKARWNK